MKATGGSQRTEAVLYWKLILHLAIREGQDEVADHTSSQGICAHYQNKAYNMQNLLEAERKVAKSHPILYLHIYVTTSWQQLRRKPQWTQPHVQLKGDAQIPLQHMVQEQPSLLCELWHTPSDKRLLSVHASAKNLGNFLLWYFYPDTADKLESLSLLSHAAGTGHAPYAYACASPGASGCPYYLHYKLITLFNTNRSGPLWQQPSTSTRSWRKLTHWA